jgi:hypothetical protein
LSDICGVQPAFPATPVRTVVPLHPVGVGVLCPSLLNVKKPARIPPESFPQNAPNLFFLDPAFSNHYSRPRAPTFLRSAAPILRVFPEPVEQEVLRDKNSRRGNPASRVASARLGPYKLRPPAPSLKSTGALQVWMCLVAADIIHICSTDYRTHIAAFFSLVGDTPQKLKQKATRSFARIIPPPPTQAKSRHCRLHTLRYASLPYTRSARSSQSTYLSLLGLHLMRTAGHE